MRCGSLPWRMSEMEEQLTIVRATKEKNTIFTAVSLGQSVFLFQMTIPTIRSEVKCAKMNTQMRTIWIFWERHTRNSRVPYESDYTSAHCRTLSFRKQAWHITPCPTPSSPPYSVTATYRAKIHKQQILNLCMVMRMST